MQEFHKGVECGPIIHTNWSHLQPRLSHPSMHEQQHIQHFHPFVHKVSICMVMAMNKEQANCLSFLTSIKALWVSHSAASIADLQSEQACHEEFCVTVTQLGRLHWLHHLECLESGSADHCWLTGLHDQLRTSCRKAHI